MVCVMVTFYGEELLAPRPTPKLEDHPLLTATACSVYSQLPSVSVGRYSDSLRAGCSGDRIAVGARFSTPVQTGSGAHPVGTGSFQEVKRPGRGVGHPPHLAPRLKKESSYISATPLGLRGLF
jgi:hypothetical protein